MMKRLLLIALLPALALTQEKRALTIDDALHLGLQNSTLLHISEAKAMGADARSSEAFAARLPSLKLQAGYTRLSDVQPFAVTLPSSPAPIVISPTVLDQYTSKISLQQPLFTGFRLKNSAAAADYAAQASHSDVEKDRVDMVFSVTVAYWSVYKAVEVKRVVDENVQQMRAHFTDVTNMMNQGVVTHSEVLKVEVQLSKAVLAQMESANTMTTATMMLNSLIGLPLDTDIQITSQTTSQSGIMQSPVALAQQAVFSRPDVHSAQMRANAAEASVSAAKGGWFPQISLFGNVYYSRPHPRVMPTKDEFKDTWDVGVNLSWDIWNWRTTKHLSDQAEAFHTQARYALEQLKDNVSLEVTHSHLSLAQSKDRVVVATMGVGLAEENYRTTRERFASGTATSTELLDAEVALLQAKLNHTVSLVDSEVAHASLVRALGREK